MAHNVYDDDGNTLVSAMGTAPRHIVAAHLGFEYEDVEPDARTCHMSLPRALVYGPVPFIPLDLARSLITLIEGHAWNEPVIGFGVCGGPGNSYIAHAESQQEYTSIPYGTRAIDFSATHQDESSHDVVKLRGPCIPPRVFTFRIETRDGKIYTSPNEYARAWIMRRLETRETSVQERIERSQNLAVLVRSICVGAKCQNAFGNRILKFIGETKDEKIARAMAEFSDESILNTPIMLIGPDFVVDRTEAFPRLEFLAELKEMLGIQDESS